MSGTQFNAIEDRNLTNISNKIVPKGYISEMILPSSAVALFTGKIAAYGNDHLRIVNTITGGKQGYAMVESDVLSSTAYEIEEHALKTVVTKRDKANKLKPYDAMKDAMKKLTTHLWLGKEKSLADALTSTAVLTQNVTLSGTSQYNDYTNSDPIGDATTAIEAIWDATGAEADTIIMDRKTFRTLKYHPKILDSLGFKDNRKGGLTEQELAFAFDVDRILIGRAIYNDAKQGQADDLKPVWGKNVIYCVAPRSPQLEQVSLGYRLQLAGHTPRKVFRKDLDEPMGATKVMVTDEYDQVLTNVNAAYLIKDSIA